MVQTILHAYPNKHILLTVSDVYTLKHAVEPIGKDPTHLFCVDFSMEIFLHRNKWVSNSYFSRT